MSVLCCVDEPQFLETCLVTIANVATCHELVCWCVGNMTMSWVTDDGIHRWHASFVLALHMSCHGILPTRDHDWLPVMVSATLKMSSEIQLQHVSGWHVAKMSTTFPTTGLENHTHKNQTLNSTKGTLKSISYCLSLHITEHFNNYCGLGNKLILNTSGRGSKLPWIKFHSVKQEKNEKQRLKHCIIISNRSTL